VIHCSTSSGPGVQPGLMGPLGATVCTPANPPDDAALAGEGHWLATLAGDPLLTREERHETIAVR